MILPRSQSMFYELDEDVRYLWLKWVINNIKAEDFEQLKATSLWRLVTKAHGKH